MDTATKVVGYGVAKYILIPLLLAAGVGLWAFLKQQKDELPDKYEKYKQDKIKSDYRKKLEKEALVEKLKQEVRDEMKEPSSKSIE